MSLVALMPTTVKVIFAPSVPCLYLIADSMEDTFGIVPRTASVSIELAPFDNLKAKTWRMPLQTFAVNSALALELLTFVFARSFPSLCKVLLCFLVQLSSPQILFFTFTGLMSSFETAETKIHNSQGFIFLLCFDYLELIAFATFVLAMLNCKSTVPLIRFFSWASATKLVVF